MFQDHARPPSNSGDSALLQSLSQLDTETWAEVLLPKLTANRAACNVALTCSQLRSLCHGSRQQLKLLNLPAPGPDQASRIPEWTSALAERFPNCCSVQLAVDDDYDLHMSAYLLSALARLPKLKTVSITVDNSPGSALPMLPFSTMLYSLHSNLPGIAELTLKFGEGVNTSALPWQEIGRATKLTRLDLLFGVEVEEPWSAGDLAALAGLTGLQSLSVTARGLQSNSTHQAPGGEWRFLSSLTALTEVDLSLAACSNIGELQGCVSLLSLTVQDLVAGPTDELADEIWGAIAHLTRLTNLSLYNASQRTTTHAFAAAISQLTRLECLAACVWAPAVLPVLQTLPKLKVVGGEWEAGVSAGVCLTRVSCLTNSLGTVPFAAFPSLTQIRQCGAFSAASLSALSKHCTGLETLVICPLEGVEVISLPDEPAKGRVAAIQSLSSLVRLTSLDFVARHNAEVVAVAATASVLLKSGCLQHLYLRLAGTECSLSSLMLLNKLSGLQQLVLHLPGVPGSSVLADADADAALLLAGLCGIGHVEIDAADSEQYMVLRGAQVWLEQQGLAAPSSLALCISRD